jgi:MFS family permease
VKARAKQAGEGWSAIPDKRPVLVMLSVGLLLMLANMSVEPIITLYVATLVSPARVTLVSGLAMSAGALGSIVSASWLGRLGDRIGPWTVITGGMLASALLLLPQAFVWEGWQLVALRFLMGLALGGLLPSVTSAIRHSVPEHVTGRVLGLATSSQFAGQVAGPLLGGFVGGHIGMRAVFLGTALVMAGGAGLAWSNRRR